MKKNWGLLLLIAGLAIAVPHGYSWWKQHQAVQSMSSDELNQYLKYDETVKQSLKTVPGTHKKGSFNVGDKVGRLTIPSIKQKYSIYLGTDKDTLTQGVGIYDSQWTVTPDQTGHVLLAGHRDTVFTELGELRIGHFIYINYNDRQFTYQIRKILITDADDLSIVVKKQKPLLTIATCYPFQFIGDAPYRYIIQSELIQVK